MTDAVNLDNPGRLALSIEEVAAVLGISRPVAYDLARRDGFPAVRVSERKIIVPVDALKRWLDDEANTNNMCN